MRKQPECCCSPTLSSSGPAHGYPPHWKSSKQTGSCCQVSGRVRVFLKSAQQKTGNKSSLKLKLNLLVGKEVVGVIHDGVRFPSPIFCLLKVWSLVVCRGSLCRKDGCTCSELLVCPDTESNGLNDQQKELLSHG